MATTAAKNDARMRRAGVPEGDCQLDEDHDDHDDAVAPPGGATLRIAGLWMSDEEMRHVAAEFASMLQPFMSGPTGPDQKRRVLRTIILPGVEPDER